MQKIHENSNALFNRYMARRSELDMDFATN